MKVYLIKYRKQVIATHETKLAKQHEGTVTGNNSQETFAEAFNNQMDAQSAALERRGDGWVALAQLATSERGVTPG